MTNNQKVLLAITLSAIFGGGNAVFNKMGLKEIPLFTFIFIRFILGLLILLPFVLKEKIKYDRNILKLFLMSLLATTNIFLFAFGVRLTSANIATMLYTCTPIITALLSVVIFKEKLLKHIIAGIILGFTGTMYIIALPVINGSNKISGSIIGNLIIFCGVICFSLYGVLSKSAQKHYSPKFVSFVFFLSTIIVSSFLAIPEMLLNPNWYHVSISAWTGLFYVGILGSIGLYILYHYAVKFGSPLIASTNSYLQPVTGVLWAALLLGERITIGYVIGALMTFVGVYLVTKK